MEKHYEGFGYRCKAADFWPITKEGLKDALTYAPQTMNKVQALAAEYLTDGVQLYDLEIAEICEVLADHSNCQQGLFWLLKNLISEREGIDLLFAQDYADSDYYILAFSIKDEDGQDIRYGNWPDIRQRMQDVYLRYQSILGVWKKHLRYPEYIDWYEKDETPCLEDGEMPWDKNTEREFYVDTPAGKLFIHAKHKGKDSPIDYPGVYIDLISPYTKEPVLLACVEFCPEVAEDHVTVTGGEIKTCVYRDAELDSPKYDDDIISYENLDIHDLEAAKEKIEAFCKKQYGSDTEVDFSDLNRISVAHTSVEGSDEELEVQAYLDLESFICWTEIQIPGLNNRYRRVIVRSDSFPSLAKMIEEQIDYMDFDSLVTLDEADWDKFSRSDAGRMWVKQKYPAGTRVKLEWMRDPYSVEAGTLGTVEYVDDGCNIHVVWDNGRTLSLVFGCDTFCVVSSVSPTPVEHPPVYRKPWSAAIFFSEKDEFRASMDANIKCAQKINEVISICYVDYRLKTDLALDILVPEYGLERLAFVLANTIRAKMHDGRIDRINKDWAYSVNVPGDDKGHDYNTGFLVDNPNPGLVNLLVNALRKRMAADQKEVQ